MPVVVCDKCGRNIWGTKGTKHILCISQDIKSIYVVHDYYGCDTGCDGHSVIIWTIRNEECNYFHFDHPGNENDKTFIERLVRDTLSNLGINYNPDWIDYDSCELFHY